MKFAKGVLLIVVAWRVAVAATASASACQSSPCLNGVCKEETASPAGFQCFCSNGYTGLLCETNYDECARALCENNSTCIDGIATYSCRCVPGFRGESEVNISTKVSLLWFVFVGDACEINVDDCESSPCKNNGTCIDGLDAYECQCLSGFSGRDCEVDDNPCNIECKNGGACARNAAGGWDCVCEPGFQGKRCEDEINECQSNPCQNGGQCNDFIAHFHCTCPVGELSCESDGQSLNSAPL